MTHGEKIKRVALLIAPDTASEELLGELLSQAEGIVLNKRYPFGIPEESVVPAKYEHIQVQIAVELFSKMGAEGQVAHSENGISRTYEAADVSPSLLNKIAPIVGGMG